MRFDGAMPGAGRPKGARNRVSKRLIEAYEAAFEQWGDKCLTILARTDPATFLKLGYGCLIPRDLNIEVSAVGEMSDEQLEEALQKLRQLEHKPALELTATPVPEKVAINGGH